MGKCKLCGGEIIDCHGAPFHTHATNCPLIGIRMTPDQWCTLMGEDKDAVRYRWLRHGDNDEKVFIQGTAWMKRNDDLDTAIDAELLKEPGQ